MPPTPDPGAPAPLETDEPGHQSGADAIDELARVKSEIRAVLAEIAPSFDTAAPDSKIRRNLDRLRRAAN